MESNRKNYATIFVLSVLITLLGVSAIVLYFLTPAYGYDALPDSTPYLKLSMVLNGAMIVLYLAVIVLARPLPSKVRKLLRSCAWADLVFIAAQVVEFALVIACEAGRLSLSTSTARTLTSGRVGDLFAVYFLFYFLRKVKPAFLAEQHGLNHPL